MNLYFKIGLMFSATIALNANACECKYYDDSTQESGASVILFADVVRFHKEKATIPNFPDKNVITFSVNKITKNIGDTVIGKELIAVSAAGIDKCGFDVDEGDSFKLLLNVTDFVENKPAQISVCDGSKKVVKPN